LALDAVSRNLTADVREGKLDPVIGRENEIERVMQVLGRRTKKNPVLVGAPGVGKTAVVEGLAQQIVRGYVPDIFKDRKIYAVDLVTTAATSMNRDTFAGTLERIVNEIDKLGHIILFIDDLHTLLWADNAEKFDVVAALKSLLARSELQIIATTTPDGYSSYLEKDAVFENAFQPIQVGELSVPQTIEVLKGIRDRYEAHHRVSITDGALVAAAQLADSSLPGKLMPGKASDLLDEAASMVRTRFALPHRDYPALREFNEKIAQVRQEKDSAVDSQDLEKAAALRDTERELLAKKASLEKDWRTGDLVPEVDDEIIAETHAMRSGIFSTGQADGRKAGQDLPFTPPVIIDDDPEIWAMS
jgi:ATP-dependent Clp protease ATP-binding subunit ClpC